MNEEIEDKIFRAHQLNIDAVTDYKSISELIKSKSEKHPDRLFLKYYNDSGKTVSYTYAEFFHRVHIYMNILTENGILFENRIATYTHNDPETVALYFAAWSSGVTVVPININEDLSRVEYILTNADVKIIFTSSHYYERIKSAAGSIKVLNLENQDFKEISIGNVRFKKEVNGGTESLVVYTSGTTGNPKGVVLTQKNMLTDAKYIGEWHNLKSGDVIFCVLPIHHVNGIIVTLITPMYFGGTVILSRKFHVNNFFNIIEKEKVKIVSVVPTILQYLLHSNEDSAKYNLNSFSHFICGAGPLTSELARNFESKFKLKIIHGYGLSETTCYSCFIPVELSEKEHKKWQNDFGFPSIGIPLKCNEMDIQNENGISMNENVRGEIVIKGHNVMKYYFENDDANESAFKNGWFRSGDEGFFIYDKDGNKYFFITGRIKELIIRGGVNISPFEIDEVLSASMYVKTGIAVGFDNDWYGEEVGAVVILKNDFFNQSKEELQTLIIKECKNKLPAYKCPKVIIFSEELPVTSTGKYQRNRLKHLFAEYRNSQFR
jgi:long-chain acyl-CoA synthetase